MYLEHRFEYENLNGAPASGDLDLILGRLSRVFCSGRPLVLLFDYDGTLAPICPTPKLAILPDAVHGALTRLARVRNVGIGVISGRALTDVRQIVGIDDIYYAGTSGLEIDLRGRILRPPGCEAACAPLDQIAGRLTDVAVRYPGAWVEQKPFGLTLHYRAVVKHSASRLRLDAGEALLPWLGQMRLQDATLGLDVLPEMGWDKGRAVREILADVRDDAFPVYVGDSADDSPALAAVEAACGLSIGVGPRVTHAHNWLPGSRVLGSLVILLANTLQDESNRLVAEG